MVDSYISVEQVNSYIKNIFDAEVMLKNICVFGEIGSYNISNGNAYFNLKDESGMLPCVLFGANKYDNVKVGDMVLVSGSISYYAKGGRLSFNAYSIEPYGKGLLFEKFLKLKAELEARGYFDPSIKKPIPERVQRIGVVSSPTGAVIRDIIDVTHRRNDTIDIVLYPVKVQGLGAEREIATGIDFFSQYENVDVVIVARGGGSMEDLEPFNTELVATAAFNCKKPLVSAVGHETDFTIIDFVADLRAPTPSAAAELVAWDKYLVQENVYAYLRVLDRNINGKLDFYNKGIDYSMDKLDDKFNYLYQKAVSSIDKSILKLNAIDSLLEKNYNNLDKLNIKLENFNPSKITKMGYSKVFKNSNIINSISKLKDNDTVSLSMIDGEVNCRVCGDNI